jgi:CHAT domain-containing protein
MQKFYWEDPNDIYRGFQKVLISQNRWESALEVSQQGKSHAITNLLIEKLGANDDVKQLFSPLTIEQIQELAKEKNTTIIDYSLIYDSSKFYWFYKSKLGFEQQYAQAISLLIWVIKPTGEITFKEVDLKKFWHYSEIDESHKSFVGLMRNLRSLLDENHENTSEKLSIYLHNLYQILIEPVAYLLPNNPQEKLIIIPQDFLFLVPFAALLDKNGQYLIDKYSINVVPSFHYLNSQNLHFPTDLIPMVLIGDVENDRIPSVHTSEEIQAIADLFHPPIFTKQEITKQVIFEQLNDTKIVHLANYCYLYDLDNLKYAIALSYRNGNSLLTAKEIIAQYQKQKRPVQTELLVLSCCDSGHDHIWGDGLMEIILSFIYMGVDGILFSLWLIPEEMRTYLLCDFYQHLQANLTKGEALRKAILTTREKYPHPLAWAGFCMFGE